MKNTLHILKRKGLLLALFTLIGVFSPWSKTLAQYSIAAGGTNYTQDFNTLTSGTWADNSTVTGWYAKTDATASITTYGANTGSTTTAGLYAFGVAGTNALTERALGFAPSNAYTGAAGTGKGYIGWRLINNTGSTINSITVTWTGEEWRKENNAAAHTLNLYYQTSATAITNLTSGSWITAPSTFTSPITGATTAAVLDGNASANRVSNISVTITVSIAAGSEIMLRWEDLNDSGNDHLLAIDDVTLNATIGAASPAISVSASTLSGLTYVFGSGPSTSQSYNISGNNLTGAPGSLTVTGSTNYEVSNNNSAWGASTTIAYASATLNNTPVYVRLKAGLGVGSYNSEIVANSGGGVSSAVNVSCSGSVTAVLPTITTTVAASSVTSSTASSGGQGINDYGNSITARGVCWSTTSPPTTANSKTSDGTGNTDFISSLTGLSAQTHYYARAYVTNSSGTGYGPEINFYTLGNEPTAPVSNLLATTTGTTQQEITWTTATFPGAGGYVLLRAIAPNVPSLTNTDGQAPVGDINTTVVSYAILTSDNSFLMTGLSPCTEYIYKLIPFCGNGSNTSSYNYLFTGAPASAPKFTACESSDALSAGGESVSISSLENTAPPLTSTTGAQVWQFTIRDGGAGMNDADALPTIVSAIKLTKNSDGQIADWDAAIQTIALFDGTTLVDEATITTVSPYEIQFAFPPISILDNTSKTFSVRLSLKGPLSAGNADKQDFVFSLTNANIITPTDGTSSQISSFTSIQSLDVKNVVDVTATKLAFVQQPTTTAVNAIMAPPVTISTTDIHGNRDLDYTSAVQITSNGTMTGDPISINAISGLATFSSVIHTVAGTNRQLTTSSGSFANIASTNFNITAIVYANNDYRTTGSGNWISNSASPAIWEKYNGSTWAPSNSPAYATTSNVYIQNGHSITSGGSFANSIKLKVMSGGIFTCNHSSTATSVYVFDGGTFNVNASFTITASGTFEVEDNGNVNINFAFGAPSSTIWQGTEIFHPASNFVFINWDAANDVILPSNTAISTNTYNGYTAAFGNIIFDFNSNLGASDDLTILEPGISINLAHGDLIFRTNATGPAIRLSTTLTVTSGIGGDFVIENSYVGSNNINLKTSGILNFTINGSWLQDACNVRIITSSVNGNSSTINILGNMTLTPSSSIDFNSTATANIVTSTINLNGDLSASSSALIQNSNSSRNGVFNFSGTGDGTTPDKTQTIDIATTSANENRYINFNVKTGAFVEFANRNLELGTNSKLTVESGGTLNFGFSGTTPLNVTNSGSMTGVNFELQSGGHLIITSTDGIASSGTTSGNVRNSGNHTFSNTGNYNYTGTSIQTTGTGLPTTVNNLTFDNSAGDSLTGGSVTVTGTLQINSGKKFYIGPLKQVTALNGLTNNGGVNGLIIQSKGSGTGSLLHNTNEVPATIERYVNGSGILTGYMYHFVSVPCTPASDNYSGIFLDSYLFDYDEAVDDWHGYGAPVDTPLDETRGFMTYAPFSSDTYLFQNPMNNGSFTATTSYTHNGTLPDDDGWNLVPNPYPSAIDWDAATGWTKTNLDGSIYILNAGLYSNTYQYSVYNTFSGGLNGGTPYIPLGQAFLVHANAASPALSMTNGIRVHNNQVFHKNTDGTIPDLLRIKATVNDKSDETVVGFSIDATKEFDPAFDAYKLFGGTDAPQLGSILADSTKLSINALPFSTTDVIVPLYFSYFNASEVTFTATGQENFTMMPPIFLEDLLLNQTINLQEQPEYTFTYQPGQANRFQLRFMDITGTRGITENNSVIFYSNSKINAEVPSMLGKQVQINIFDIAGRLMKSTTAVMNGVVTIDAPVATGVYIVRVISGNKIFTGKVVVK